MRAFCYCRVSTEEQSADDHHSLDNQERKAKDYAELKNWNVLKTRKDVASGKDTISRSVARSERRRADHSRWMSPGYPVLHPAITRNQPVQYLDHA